ncbi:hypothetical protein TNCV_1211651 [Trichonephila clavipes]|nr:hypothetical protein TNCV_1211651 [Trichonephila clavipes]
MWVGAMPRLDDAGSNDEPWRTERQKSSSRPKEMIEHEDRVIVRSALIALMRPLCTIPCVTVTTVTAMTIDSNGCHCADFSQCCTPSNALVVVPGTFDLKSHGMEKNYFER